MPAMYQGVRLQEGAEPFPNLAAPEGTTAGRQLSKLQYLNELNGRFAAENPQQSELEARLASYELAFRMQAHAPEAVAIETESAATQRLYGMDDKETQVFGRMCLLARRLVERGVRFVQLYHGAGSKWDAHSGIEANHTGLCRASDRPVAGLLRDLKQRGLLEETLVVWGGEFGRTPLSEGKGGGKGRDHNPHGYSMWMAGGGIKGGVSYGATDEIGLYATENKTHVRDIHATILHTMGLNHEALEVLHDGRFERLTDIGGRVIHDILA